jgi:hypothetical protein
MSSPDLSLSDPEAEIMFTVWLSNRPIDNEEISEEHYRIFRSAEKKNEATVRGIISRIKKLEAQSGRTYLSSTKKRQHVHQIDTRQCVHSQGTAVILLELKKGYLEYGRPEKEILRKPFEQYINKKYGESTTLFKGPSDIHDRLAKAETKGYVRFVKYGRAAGIDSAERLDDDLPYLLFIVENYLKYKEGNVKDSSSTKFVADLRSLLSLFGRNPAGTSLTKQVRGGN